jgi:hypothetical protein
MAKLLNSALNAPEPKVRIKKVIKRPPAIGDIDRLSIEFVNNV